MPILEPIQQSVCETFGVTPEQLASRSRVRHIAEARFAYIAKAYETGRFSHAGLASIVGMDSATIGHAICRAKELREVDSAFQSLYLRIVA